MQYNSMDQQKPATFSSRTKLAFASVGLLGLVLLLTVSLSLQKQEQRSKASTSGINYITNPGCESNTTGWATWQGVLSRSTSYAHSGSASCYVKWSTGAAYSIDDEPNSVVKPLQGEKFTGTAWVRSDSAVGQPVYLALRLWTGTSFVVVEGPKYTLTNTWQQITNTVTVDTSTRDYLDMYVVQDPATVSGSAFYVDDMSLQLTNGTACAGLTVVTPLAFDKTTASAGQTINATITYKNNCASAYSISDILVAGRTPSGGYRDFSDNTAATTLQPGQTVTLSASLTITSADPTGQWTSFGSYLDSSGNWHEDTTKLYFTVGAPATATPVPPTATKAPTATPVPTCSGLTVVTPLAFDKTTASAGQTINATITYKNNCASAYSISDILVAGRTPSGGYRDFSDNTAATTLQPGQTVTLSASLTITSADPTGQWTSFGSYLDSSGNWHEDTTKLYFTVGAPATATPVPPTATKAPTATPVPTCAGLTVITPLKFDRTSVTVGQAITATMTYKNNCTVPYQLGDITIVAIDPSGNQVDFSDSVSGMIVQPGQTITISASKTISSSDLSGQWYAYGSFMDSNWVWHDDPTKIYFSVTAAPTATPVVVLPSSTPRPTATPVVGSTSVTLSLLLHGIGYGGDNVTPNAQGNMNPLHPQRTVTVDVYDVQNQLVGTKQGMVSFNQSTGNFTGNVDLGTQFATGIYTVKVKTDQFLRGLVSGIQTITVGQTNNLPQLTMINGDVNNDNQINIVDYNILLGCYSDLLPAVSCNDVTKGQSDLNDDGNVNQYDYNLFIRELTNIGGQ